MSTTPPTKSKTYTLRPAWLTESLSTLQNFQKTSDAVRQEFNLLNKAFDNFDQATANAAASDLLHATNLAKGYKSTEETPQQRKHKLIVQSRRHPFVCLPTDIHGRIVLDLDLFGVDRLLSLSQVVRTSFSFNEVWKEWGETRWCIGLAEGKSNKLNDRTSWLSACHLRASILRPILLLCHEYRHRDAGSYKTAGLGNLSAWSELLCGLIFLTSTSNDWVSRKMIRNGGGVRLLMGLAEHDSHNIRTLAIASLGNGIACANQTEQQHWITNLTSYRAAKIFSSIMISPLSDVTSNSSREASRALVNLALPHTASISLEREVLSRSSGHWRGKHVRWEKDGNWKLQLTFQSGGLVNEQMVNIELKFQKNGVLSGCGLEKGKNNNTNRLLFIKGWYDFNEHQVGVGQISFTVYKTEEEAMLAADGLMNETSLVSNESLGGVGGIRNFTGYCTSASSGFFGIWENAGAGDGGKTIFKLTGGGGFRLRWRRTKKNN